MKMGQRLKLEPWTVLQRQVFDNTVVAAEKFMEDSA